MKKGFTLIELLAVIVILAIIAVIAVPIVINIIEESKNNATLRSAEMYMDAVELSIANRVMHHGAIPNKSYPIMSDGNICLEKYEKTETSETCTDEDGIKDNEKLEVEVKGEAPSEGTISILGGEIAYVEGIKIGDNKISTGFDDKIINSDYREICVAVTEDNASRYETIDKYYDSDTDMEVPYYRGTSGNIPQGKYEPGDEYICEVKPGVSYRFFVKQENRFDPTKVDLLIEANINSKGEPIKISDATDKGLVPWLSKKDYVDAGGDLTYWGSGSWIDECTPLDDVGLCGKAAMGPITLYNYLSKATQSWINLNNIKVDSNLINGDSFLHFSMSTDENSVTTITTSAGNVVAEYKNLKAMIGHDYSVYSDKIFYKNYLKGSSIFGSTVTTEVDGIEGYWQINSWGSYGTATVIDGVSGGGSGADVDTEGKYGVRPIITVSKNNIKN